MWKRGGCIKKDLILANEIIAGLFHFFASSEILLTRKDALTEQFVNT
jgi:hypothetical protein